MQEIQLAKLKSREVKEYAAAGAVVVVPCGSIEQHGPHLPVDVDSFLVSEVARRAAETAGRQVPVLVTPTVTFGCSEHHLDFTGTISLTQDTFILVLQEVCTSLIHHGFRRILILNGHSGNTGAVTVAANKIHLAHPESTVVFFNYWALAGEAMARVRSSEPGGAAHAGEFETSLYLALDPERVSLDAAVREIPAPRLTGERIDLFQWGRINIAFNMSELTRSGVVGDPLVATREKGESILAALISQIAAVIKEMAALKA